ncbi:hypothetical protein [Pseudomonas knackmussii]|uniref:hypothetical protein n=1 Tax=Pseudomonas knackmussii TaxID=65741 RepID=UPI001362BF2B|nr:hypothetical protein [Pseudomonas knackmussii]
MELSDQARAICAKNYRGWQQKINGCGKCPIHAACTAQIHWSQKGLDESIAKVNEAAERLPHGAAECAAAQLDIFSDIA